MWKMSTLWKSSYYNVNKQSCELWREKLHSMLMWQSLWDCHGSGWIAGSGCVWNHLLTHSLLPISSILHCGIVSRKSVDISWCFANTNSADKLFCTQALYTILYSRKQQCCSIAGCRINFSSQDKFQDKALYATLVFIWCNRINKNQIWTLWIKLNWIGRSVPIPGPVCFRAFIVKQLQKV